MINLTGTQLREKFLKFFESKGHLILPSASLIPEDDPTLLLIGAGMAPFKPFFTGKLTPPRVRVVTCQKCVRTGDIENVGRTARHHTFFEMLGNFSFGDYFKKDAIAWAWEFITEVLQIPAEKLWVTIHPSDDEAFDLWHEGIGVPAERIIRLEENFWEIGPGPCGPCSEIHVDLGEERGCGSPDCKVGCDCDRYLEIWNLVFTQFNKELDGTYTPLEKKNIDTGAGLDRIASVLQNKRSNFETDLVFPIVKYAADTAGVTFGKDSRTDVSLKVIADHARSMTVMISDGVAPSNEGRGYVLRRILRRAVRHGKLLGIDKMFLAGAVDAVIAIFGTHYKELITQRDYIQKVIRMEEERFNTTLAQGTELLNSEIEKLKQDGQNMLDGNIAFKLYDTFGFPWELTEEILAEHDLAMNKRVFDQAMEEQRERARAARSDKDTSKAVLDFTGCDTSALRIDENVKESEIMLILDPETGKQELAASEGQKVAVVLKTTPFRVEGGGQVGDIGSIVTDGAEAYITEARKLTDGTVVQYGKVVKGMIQWGDKVKTKVDLKRKKDTARNHTATHLLHAALKKVLGDHVNQAGSYVGPDRLRFDFSHFAPVGKEELGKIEEIVNREILRGKLVSAQQTNLDTAREMGAVALFGEKYGDIVRVVSVDGFSMELCGGSHVGNVAEIGLFKIIGEGSTGAGIRRIEAVTGRGAYEYVQNTDGLIYGLATSLRCRPEDLAGRVEGLQNEIRAAKEETAKLAEKLAGLQSGNLEEDVREFNGIKASVLDITTTDTEALRAFGDKVRDKLGTASVTVLFSVRGEDKLDLLIMAGKDAVAKGLHAGKLAKEIAAVVGGGGGGRPDMAQAGGKQPQNIPVAIEKAWQLIEEQSRK